MDYEGLTLEVKENIAVLTLSRPESMNVINSELLNGLGEAIKDLSHNKNVRAMIITGEGKAFAAGADIKELKGMKPDKAFNFSRKGQQIFQRLENLDFPVIAGVNGFALGGGCELAMACDFRIAAETAKLGLPEVSLGLMPGFAGTQRMIRLIGYANAMYLMVTAETITALEAQELGLVQKVTEPVELMDACFSIAKKISKQGKYAVRAVKELTRKGMHTDFDNAGELESEVFAGLFDRPEANEGINAFLEKRAPNW